MELHLLFTLVLLASLGSVISYPHPEGLASMEEKGLGPILKGNASKFTFTKQLCKVSFKKNIDSFLFKLC